ncbi:MAG: metal ABC transporter substrate-binding protein [Sedimentisphaerales bacterium]
MLIRKIIPCLLALAMLTGLTQGAEQAAKKRVLCTTFPIYQITRNVTQGRDAVVVSLMIPAGMGCPHDYALTPQDMKKIAEADILVVNGLGMEEFLGAPIGKANPNVIVIDSSKGIKGTLYMTGEDEEDEKEAKNEQHEEGHHHHEGPNPHLFASPRMAAQLAINIAEELSKTDANGAALYKKNAEEYALRLRKLADEFAATGRTLKNNRIVTQHGVFDYLARDTGLEIVAVVQEHAGQEPSAAKMLSVAKAIREKKAGAIFTEPQYPAATGETLARETGIPAATLDPAASGPENAGLDYYEKVMKANLETLKSVLGTK